MRLLHTSDWHLGATLGRVSRAPDHDALADEIVAVTADARPDLVVHTGDLFDHARPGTDDLHRAVSALERLGAIAPVVVIAGNHDSPALFAVLDRLTALGRSGPGRVRFVGRARPPRDGGILEYPANGGHERIRVAPLPFVHPNAYANVFDVDPTRWTSRYADQVAVVAGALGVGLSTGFDLTHDIAVFAAHLHVDGAVFGGSERPLHITDSYATRASAIPPVSYAAFGHIHKPQPVPGLVTGVYAGSPLQIDFGEEGEVKSVVLVDAAPGRPAHVERIRLSAARPLMRVAGTLDELAVMAASVRRVILLAVVEVAEPTSGLADRVSALFPEATLLDVQERWAGAAAVVVEDVPDPKAEPTLADLLDQYLAENPPRDAPPTRVRELVGTLLEAAAAGDTVDLVSVLVNESEPPP